MKSAPVFLALVALMLLAPCAPANAAASLRVRADSWMPYNGQPEHQTPGYAVEILRRIFEPNEITVDYQLTSWEDALAAARDGKIEAVIGANKTEAKGLLVPKETIGMPRMAFWVKKSSTWQYVNLASLAKVKVGVIEGYSYWDTLDAQIAAGKDGIIVLSGEKPLAEGIRMLNAGELDVMTEAVPVFIWAVKSAGLSPSDYRIAYTEVVEPIYIAFADTDLGRRRSKAFDEGIRQLRANGELKEILKKYGVVDWNE